MIFPRLAAAVLVCVVATAAAAADRVALVIGNGAYQGEAVLANPTKDARDISTALARHGFEVTALLDLDRRGMEDALRSFRSAADRAEIALVYYAGHGIEVDGANFLLPTDARLAHSEDVEWEAIPLDRVVRSIDGAEKLAMVVLDACRNNPFANQMRSAGGTRSIGRGMGRPPPTSANTLIAYAAAEGSTTPDGEPGANSPFTAAFLAALDGPPRDVRLMLGAVSEGVRERIGPGANPAVYQQLGSEEIVLNASAVRVPPPPSNVLQVSSDGSGQYRDIGAAVADARPGTRIEILPGTYRGGVDIDKPLEIVGVGTRSTIVLEAEDDDVIRWSAQTGLLSNITLRQTGSAEDAYYGALTISAGAPVIENNDIVSTSSASVFVYGDETRPTLRGNRVHGARHAGIVYYAGAGGLMIGNEVYENAYSGIEVREGAAPEIRDNLVRDGGGAGVFVYDAARPLVVGNEIVANAGTGVQIKTAGDPELRDNVIRDGESGGVYVYENGLGRIFDNEIAGNRLAGVEIREGGAPEVRGNLIRDGAGSGVFVNEGGMGRIIDNEIQGHVYSGVIVQEQADPEIRDNVIRDNEQSGIFVTKSGRGTFATNEITGNAFSGIAVSENAAPRVVRNTISENARWGIQIRETAGGTFTGNDLRGNDRGAFDISADAGTVVRRDNRE